MELLVPVLSPPSRWGRSRPASTERRARWSTPSLHSRAVEVEVLVTCRWHKSGESSLVSGLPGGAQHSPGRPQGLPRAHPTAPGPPCRTPLQRDTGRCSCGQTGCLTPRRCRGQPQPSSSSAALRTRAQVDHSHPTAGTSQTGPNTACPQPSDDQHSDPEPSGQDPVSLLPHVLGGRSDPSVNSSPSEHALAPQDDRPGQRPWGLAADPGPELSQCSLCAKGRSGHGPLCEVGGTWLLVTAAALLSRGKPPVIPASVACPQLARTTPPGCLEQGGWNSGGSLSLELQGRPHLGVCSMPGAACPLGFLNSCEVCPRT